jgi:hypothetical protein
LLMSTAIESAARATPSTAVSGVQHVQRLTAMILITLSSWINPCGSVPGIDVRVKIGSVKIGSHSAPRIGHRQIRSPDHDHGPGC